MESNTKMLTGRELKKNHPVVNARLLCARSRVAAERGGGGSASESQRATAGPEPTYVLILQMEEGRDWPKRTPEQENDRQGPSWERV